MVVINNQDVSGVTSIIKKNVEVGRSRGNIFFKQQQEKVLFSLHTLHATNKWVKLADVKI